MNTRDPFNLRQKSPVLGIFQSSASAKASRLHSLAEGGKAVEGEVASAAQTATASMSSYASPSAAPTQRHPDLWQSSSRSRFESDPQVHSNGGIAEKVNDFFGAERRGSLPMYKDKPYAYPGSRRRQPLYRRKRMLALGLLILSVLSWWFGILSPMSWFTSSSSDDDRSKTKSTPSWFGGGSKVDWNLRAEQVKSAFQTSWAGYEKYAWGYDEFRPVSKNSRQMTPKGMGWIIVDALDTMMLMNLSTELTHARQWIHSNLTYDQDHDVNTFETTIRMLGGLLSAHYLSTDFNGVYAPVDDGLSDDLYVEKATDLADRLLGAYETKSGVPLASVNLHTSQGIPSHADGGSSSTAEATTLQLEMKYLAKLTGEDHYWEKAEHVMKVVDDNNVADGLVPIFISADRGTFRGENIRLGSRGDSYYEYLVKQYLQTSREEPIYQEMWNESLAGVKKHLLTYSSPSNFTVLAERPSGLKNDISPKMDHLVCFMPGTIALATTGGLTLAQAKAQPGWGPKQDEDMRLAEELTKTCWGMYKYTPTGLAGEITFFNIHKPPVMYNDFPSDAKPSSPPSFDESEPQWKDDFIVKPGDSHNLQRPETVESLFYMWRITGDEKYREWGWEMFESFMKWTVVDGGAGYSSISNVMTVPPLSRDNMESFWLAETLKYLFLLFSPNDVLPLDGIVFNTEAHPFPRFQLGKLFKTGWQRTPRDKNGNLPADAQPVETRADSGQPIMKTVRVTQTAVRDADLVKETPATAEGGLDAITGKEKEGP